MMVTVRLHRRVNLFTRFVVGIFSAISLGFFITNLFHVFDANFWPEKPGISTLIVGALSFSLLWTVISIGLLLALTFNKYVQITGDIISFLMLIILGPISFAHDDRHYFSNGLHMNYDNWFLFAAIGGGFAIAVLVFQLFLIVWGFLMPSRKVLPDFRSGNPPPYKEDHSESEKGKEFEGDWDSVSEVDVPRLESMVKEAKA